MGYDTAGLLDDVGFKLQHNFRYTRDIMLDGLNRGIEKLIMYASEDYDVREILNPPDPTGEFTYAMEWPLPTDSLYIDSVSARGIPILRCTQPQFVATRAEQSHRTATVPAIYYIRANKYLNVYPRPSQQYKYQIYGLFKPADLVNDDDPIPLDRLYSDALVSYAAWWCLQGQTDEIARTTQFQQDYLMQRAEAKFNKTQNGIHSITNVKPIR